MSGTAAKDELYIEEQIRTALTAYTASNDLQLQGTSIKLDKLMISNLFNKKEPQMEGDTCPFEDVIKRLLGKLQLFHKVSRVTDQVSTMQHTTLQSASCVSIHTCVLPALCAQMHCTHLPCLH